MKVKKYKVNFILERRKDKELGERITWNVPIFMDVTFSGKRMSYFTQYRADWDKWIDTIVNKDGSKVRIQRVKQNTINKYGESASIINMRLNDLEKYVGDIFKVSGKDIPTPGQLRFNP